MSTTKEQLGIEVGSVLLAVIYQFSWESDPQPCGEADVVSMGVRLEFEDHQFVNFRWLMEGEIEMLAVGERGLGEPTPPLRELNASPRWHHMIGTRLQAVSWGLQSGPEIATPWSCRVSFTGGHSLVVALGECDGSATPSYIPDSLIVTASREIAGCYRPIAAMHSAWGPDE